MHARMESSARTGFSHWWTREPFANTPMYITTTNNASDSMHLPISSVSGLVTARGSSPSIPAIYATSATTARA